MATDFAKKVNDTMRMAGSPVDLRAAVLGVQTDPSLLDRYDSGVNLLKAALAVAELVKNIPIVGTILNVASTGSNIYKAQQDLANLRYISAAVQIGLLGDVAAVASGLGFAAAATGVVAAGVTISTPLIVAASALIAGVGIASTYASSNMGYDNKQLELSLVDTASAAAQGLGKFSEFKWANEDETAIKTLQKDSPLLYPIVQMLHFLSPSLTVAEALKIADGSASGATLQEAAATLNSVRKFITGQPAVAINNTTDYLTELNHI